MTLEKLSGDQESEVHGAASWNLLEEEADACAVLTRRMEVVYLNAAARRLVPRRWFGCRCWEIFPVADESCAARCPAVQAVSSASAIDYCEETIYPGGEAVPVGVAVVPIAAHPSDGKRAVFIIRPKPPGCAEADFRRSLLERAGAIQSRLHEAGGR